MPNFTVIPFAPNTRVSCRLTQQDKVDVWFWEQTALDRGYDRVVVQANSWVQGLEQDEFVLIYRLGHRWARWGAAREGGKVMVWRCSDGAEAGLYVCMKSALDEIPYASTAYIETAMNSSECRVTQIRSIPRLEVLA